MQCPLCKNIRAIALHCTNPNAKYWDCAQCGLIYADTTSQLTPEKEKERYLKHNNDVLDPRYQTFVSDIIEYIKQNVSTDSRGLDFGAGPGPVISHLLGPLNYEIDLFDPFFHNDPTKLKMQYDFIVCCEVAEHFYYPQKEFKILLSCLRPQSPLLIKTEFFKDSTNFNSWYYRKDPTHVSFYREQTMTWIKDHIGFTRLDTINSRTVALWK